MRLGNGARWALLALCVWSLAGLDVPAARGQESSASGQEGSAGVAAPRESGAAPLEGPPPAGALRRLPAQA